MEAVNVRRRDESAVQKSVAWWTAKFTAEAMAGTLKPLPDVVKTEPKKQTKGEFATMARLLAERYGHRIIPRTVH